MKVTIVNKDLLTATDIEIANDLARITRHLPSRDFVTQLAYHLFPHLWIRSNGATIEIFADIDKSDNFKPVIRIEER